MTGEVRAATKENSVHCFYRKWLQLEFPEQEPIPDRIVDGECDKI